MTSGKSPLILRIVAIGIIFLVLFALFQFNYLLFHSAVGIFSVVIAAAVFILTWNAPSYVANTYLSVLGAGYLAVALLDFLHVFTHPDMNIITQVAPDAGIQLWICGRSVESVTILFAALYLKREVKFRYLPVMSIGIFAALSTLVLVWPVFPTCYIPGVGFTPFKIGSEYAIILVLLVSLFLLRRNSLVLDDRTQWLLNGAVWVAIAAEVPFTLHSEAYGLLNVVGHYLKFISIYLIYLTVVENGVVRPFGRTTSALRNKSAALKEKEDQFRLLAEISDGVFWIASVDIDRFFYISPGFEKLWQRPCSALYDDAGLLERTIHPDDRQRVMASTRKAVQGSWEIDFRILTPDGDMRWIRDHGYPLRDETGRITKLCGMGYDITSQKQMEGRLRQTRQTLKHRVRIRTKALSKAIGYLKDQVREKTRISTRLKERNLMLDTLVRSIPDMISYKDVDGRYLISNPAHREFFDIEGKPVIGHTDKELKSAQLAREGAERERQVIDKGVPCRFESPLESSTGRKSIWDIRKIPVTDDTGRYVGILSLSREVTEFKQRELELRQSQSMLQAFLNGISDPMLMIDSQLQVVYINRAASVEFSSAIKMGEPGSCIGILCDGIAACETCQLQVFMDRKTPMRFEHHRPDTERVEEVHLYPLFEERDGLDGGVVRIADITESKQLERHLVHSEKMSALGMLVAGMVHEINNPNSFISFNLPILRAYLGRIFQMLDTHPKAVTAQDWFGMDYAGFRQEVYSLLGNLSHGSSRIDNIIANLKSMIHPRQKSVRQKWVHLDGVIEKAVVLCRGEIRKRVKVFEVHASRYAIQLKTDPEALEQVLINLLINASHAADKKDSWVKIETRESTDQINRAIIEISDNGCGMDKETMARIFDPFYTTKGPGVGTGLGLSVSYSLVDQLGGEIVVNSSLGKGTSFKVILPCESGPEDLLDPEEDHHRSTEDEYRRKTLN